MADNKIKYTFLVDDQVSPALDRVYKSAVSASKEVDKAIKNAENFLKATPNNLSAILKVQFDQFSRLREDIQKDLVKFQQAESILRSQIANKKEKLSEFGNNLPTVVNKNSGLNVLASKSSIGKEIKYGVEQLTALDNKLKNIQVYGKMLELETFFGSTFPTQIIRTKNSLELFKTSLQTASSSGQSWNDLISKAESYRLQLEKTRVSELSNLDRLASRHREYSAQVVQDELNIIAQQERKIQQIVREQLELQKAKNLFAAGYNSSTTRDDRGYKPQVTSGGRIGNGGGIFGNFNSSGGSIPPPPKPVTPESLALQKQSTLEAEKQAAAINHANFFSQSLYKRILDIAIGWRAINSAINLFVRSITNIPKLGIELEQTNAIFRAVFGTTAQVNKELSFLDKLAAEVGLNIGVLREQFGQFAASAIPTGESLTKVEQIFRDFSEVGAVLHLPEDKLKAVFTAVNQMYGKNQVMMEELKRQLGNQLPAAVSVFAIATGKSTKQLIADMRAGTVFPKETLAAFAATYKTIFADTNSLSIATQGLNANWQRFETAVINASQAVYKATSGVMIGTLKLLTSAIETTGKAFDNFFNKTYELEGQEISRIKLIAATWEYATQKVKEYATDSGLVNRAKQAYDFLKKGSDAIEFTGKNLAGVLTSEGKVFLNDLAAVGNGLREFHKAFVPSETPFSEILKSTANAYNTTDIWKPLEEQGERTFKEIVKIAKDNPAKISVNTEAMDAAAKQALLATSQGSEAIASLTSQEVSRQIQLQANLSANIIKGYSSLAKKEIEVLRREATTIDAKLRNNNIGMLSWYKSRVELVEKEYQITLKRIKLEEQQLKDNLVAEQQISGKRTPMYGNLTESSYLQKNKDFQEKEILRKAGIIPTLKEARLPAANYDAIQEFNKQATLAAESIAKKVKEEIEKIDDKSTLTPAQKLVYENSPNLSSKVYESDQLKAAKVLQDANRFESESATRELQQRKITNDALELGIKNNVVELRTNSQSIKQLIDINAERFGIDKNLLTALVNNESGGNPNAVSKAGAVGLTQLMPGTARDLGVTNRLDAEQNLKGGSKYLSQLLIKYNGDVVKALSAYNAGPGNIDKAIRKHGEDWHASLATWKDKSGKPALEAFEYAGKVLGQIKDNIPTNLKEASTDKTRASTSLVRFQANTLMKFPELEADREQSQLDKQEKLAQLQEQLNQYQLEYSNQYSAIVADQNRLIYGKQQEVAENENNLRFSQIEKSIAQNLLDYEKATNEEKIKLDRLGLGEKQLKQSQQAIEFLKEQTKLQAELAKIEYDRSNVQNATGLQFRDMQIQAERGNLTPFEQIYQESTIAKDRLPDEQVAAQSKINNIQQQFSSGLISEQDKNNQIKQVSQELDDLQTKAQGVQTFMQTQLSGAISGAMMDWATGAKTASQAFKELGISLIKMLMDVIAQMIALAAAKMLVKAAGSMFGGGFSDGGSVGFSSGGSISSGSLLDSSMMPALAGGGQVLMFPGGGRVPSVGTSVSDSVMANVPIGSYILKANSANKLRKNRMVRLSKDEEVVPPEVVALYGKEYFDKLNRTGETKFAEGGFVGNGKGAGGTIPFNNKGHSTSITNINKFETTIVQKDGENSKDLSERVAMEMMRKIAKEEAKQAAVKHVASYDKQQKMTKRRAV